jgi:hypothetical protein
VLLTHAGDHPPEYRRDQKDWSSAQKIFAFAAKRDHRPIIVEKKMLVYFFLDKRRNGVTIAIHVS